MSHVVSSHTSYHFLFVSQYISKRQRYKDRWPAVPDSSCNLHGKYTLSSLWTCFTVSYGPIERKNTFDLVTNMCVWFLVSPDMVSVTMLSLTSAKMWNLLFRWGHPQSCFCYCFSYGSNENGGWKIGSAAYHGPQTQGWRCILHIPRVLSLAEVKILNCEQKILHVHTHTHTCTRTRTHTHWG